MAEELGGYFCPKIGPRLMKVYSLLRPPLYTYNRQLVETELEWLADRFLGETVGVNLIKRGRTQRHRAMAMGPQEKDLVKATRRLAVKCLDLLRSEKEVPAELRQEWKVLINENSGKELHINLEVTLYYVDYIIPQETLFCFEILVVVVFTHSEVYF